MPNFMLLVAPEKVVMRMNLLVAVRLHEQKPFHEKMSNKMISETQLLKLKPPFCQVASMASRCF